MESRKRKWFTSDSNTMPYLEQQRTFQEAEATIENREQYKEKKRKKKKEKKNKTRIVDKKTREVKEEATKNGETIQVFGTISLIHVFVPIKRG